MIYEGNTIYSHSCLLVSLSVHNYNCGCLITRKKIIMCIKLREPIHSLRKAGPDLLQRDKGSFKHCIYTYLTVIFSPCGLILILQPYSPMVSKQDGSNIITYDHVRTSICKYHSYCQNKALFSQIRVPIPTI